MPYPIKPLNVKKDHLTLVDILRERERAATKRPFFMLIRWGFSGVINSIKISRWITAILVIKLLGERRATDSMSSTAPFTSNLSSISRAILIPKGPFSPISLPCRPTTLLKTILRKQKISYGVDSAQLDIKDKSLLDYIASIYEADRALEFFFQGPDSNGLLDNTFVFIYSDHIGNMIDLNCHGECIPLIVYHKDLENKDSHWHKNLNFKPGTYLKAASHLDLAPTIAAMLGKRAPEDWLGSPLISAQTVELENARARHPSHTQEIISPEVISNFKLGKFLEKNPQDDRPLYYERGVTWAQKDAVLYNAKENPLELVFKRKNLLP